VRVWRICRKPYATDALVGRGGLLTSGRWHTRGRPVVYTSQSLALAALEVLVHVDQGFVPSDLIQVEIAVPDDLDVQRIGVRELPKTWRLYPALPALQKRGDEWLAAGSTPILQVPSSVIPEEFNFLLNPRHRDAKELRVVSTARFSFDPRLGS